jgi:hypothetical protein
MKCLLALALASTFVSTGCTAAYRMQPDVAALMVAAPEQAAERPPPENHIVYVYGPPPATAGEPVVMPKVAGPDADGSYGGSGRVAP